MAAANVVLPPAGKVSLISIWIETLLYGINLVVYGLCMYVLLRERSTISNRWVLVVTSTILFLLASAHVASALEQLLEAYVYAPPGVPEYADIYFLATTRPMRMLQGILFILLLLVQSIVLIWRLYVVFCRDWRVIVLPILLEAATVGLAAASAVLAARGDNVVRVIGVASCGLNLAVHVLVTVATAARLWWQGRIVSSLCKDSPRHHPYAAAIWVIIESGGIFAGVIIISMCFLATKTNHVSFVLSGIYITSQFAALTPLLIVVRVGLGLTHGLQEAYQGILMSRVPMAIHSGIRFRAGEARHNVEPGDKPFHSEMSFCHFNV